MTTYAKIRSLAHDAGLAVERVHLERALSAHGWQIVATARGLGITPSTLQKALQRHPALASRLQDGRKSPKTQSKKKRRKNTPGA